MRLAVRFVPLALAVAVLAGCPEERPDAKRPLPRDRFPPAMPVQPKREPALVAPAPSTTPTATPLPGGAPRPAPTGGATPAR